MKIQRFLITIWMILLVGIVHSQHSVVDSLQQALDTAQTVKSKFRILNLLCQHTTQKDRNLAMYYARTYDSLAQDIDDTYQKGRAKVLIGSVDFMSGDYEKAAVAFLTAMTAFENLKDSAQIGALYNNMSGIAWAQRDTFGAINYLQQAIPFYSGSTRIRRLIINHTNLGNMLIVAGQYDEAEKYLLKAIEYIHEIKIPSELGLPYSMLSDLYVKKKLYEQAEIYANNALKYLSVTKDVQTILGVWRTKAQVALERDQLENARICLTEAQKIVEENNIRSVEKGLLSSWLDYYRKVGDFRNAFNFSEQIRHLSDSLLHADRDRNLTELREKFEADKKEKEIAVLSMQNDLIETKMQASKRQNMGLIIGLLLLMGISTILFKLYQKIEKQNKVISIALREKDTLLREIHHRVKNNLQVISSLLSLQSKYIQDENALDALRQGQDRVRSMALIHQDLYQNINLRGVNAEVYLTKLLENLLRSYKIREDEIKLDIQVEPINLDVDTMIPLGLMMNELISNALKHAFVNTTEPKIRISLWEQNQYLHLEIADNGTGVADLKEMEKKSFGFSLIKMFATKLKADLDIQSKQGFEVKMKIKQFEKAA